MQDPTGQAGGPSTRSGGGSRGGARAGSGTDLTGQSGVESALGRDRTADGELPAELGTNRVGMNPNPVASAGLAPSDADAGQDSGITGQAKRMAGDVAGQAQDTTGRLVDQVKRQTSARLSGQIDQAAEALGVASDAVFAVGRQLREYEQGTVAGYTDQLGEQVQRASTYLRDKDLDQLVDDTERFARRQPLVFLGGAFTLGLLAARFLKSSGQAAQPPVDRSTAARAATPFHLQQTTPGAQPSYAYNMPPVPTGRATGLPAAPSSSGTTGVGSSGLSGVAGTPSTTGTTGTGALRTGPSSGLASDPIRRSEGTLDYGQPT